MTLIKSISGIRGTIGGKAGSSLSPIDIVKFTSAFAKWLKEANSGKKKVVIGRDARLSGTMVQQLVSGSLIGMGMDVIDAGLSTTPTVEMAVPFHKAAGGIIITASHNPKEWNALKLLNHKGEFISDADGKTILEYADSLDIDFAEVNDLGKRSTDTEALKRHIEAILALEQVDAASIQKRDFKIVVDGVNSSGGFAVPELLEALGVRKIETIFCEPTGLFPHNPEPLPEHLEAIVERVLMEQADLGIVVDPDVTP
jgi:phosphomannomutase